MFDYTLFHQDQNTFARRGQLTTPHGTVELPTFMPVGTRGSVKGIEVEQLKATGSQIILGNTYHLMDRPGEDIVEHLGGLHTFCGWEGPILTDSGGFQIFSLARLMKIDEEGAVFRSHTDGHLMDLTPERAVRIQEKLGSDIAMVLDHVVALPNERLVIKEAMERTIRWAKRCKEAHQRTDQAQFAIVQGGLEVEMRRHCAEELVSIGFDGYAIGGLSVGELPEQMYDCLEKTLPFLPGDRPRYLMGVGRPQDLLEGIKRGVDMFDCVMPSRNGRNAMAFTNNGPLRLRNACHERDNAPLEEGCPCPACRRSRGYIHHLFQTGEMLGPILLTLHNLTFYQRLMAEARMAIENDDFLPFYYEKMKNINLDNL